MAQHAELSPPREHDGAEAGRESEQADQHRHCLHRIGDGEAAVENAQRQLPDLARGAKVDPGAAGQRADRVHGLRRRRARREPQRRVVHAPVAGERSVIGAVDENRAVLAGVIAEHSRNHQRDALAVDGQLDFLARRKAIQIADRFADPHRSGVARLAQILPANFRKRLLGAIARDQHKRRARRIEEDAARAQEVGARHLRQRAHALLEPGLEVAGVAGMAGAEVELCRQHRVEPVIERLPERRDHDRHRGHEREAGDDRSEADCRLPRCAAQLGQRERQAGLPRQRQRIEHRLREPRHERDAADEQAADGGVAADRQPADRSELRKRGADEDENQSGPG